MLEEIFLLIGLSSNLLSIAIFILRKRTPSLLTPVGSAYLLLAIPAVYGLALVQIEQKSVLYGVFLGIFLGFLCLEGLYDFVLKVPFRRNWKLLTPYLLLYFSMNYGFVVMVWKNDVAAGMLLLGLFAAQLVFNAWSHPRKTNQ